MLDDHVNVNTTCCTRFVKQTTPLHPRPRPRSATPTPHFSPPQQPRTKSDRLQPHSALQNLTHSYKTSATAAQVPLYPASNAQPPKVIPAHRRRCVQRPSPTAWSNRSTVPSNNHASLPNHSPSPHPFPKSAIHVPHKAAHTPRHDPSPTSSSSLHPVLTAHIPSLPSRTSSACHRARRCRVLPFLSAVCG